MTEEDRQVAGRYTVQSVVPGRCGWSRSSRAARRAGSRLSELARALGTSKSSTLALARTLVASGYLRDAHPGPGYTLGTGLIEAG